MPFKREVVKLRVVLGCPLQCRLDLEHTGWVSFTFPLSMARSSLFEQLKNIKDEDLNPVKG